jgi:hypothetical protein
MALSRDLFDLTSAALSNLDLFASQLDPIKLVQLITALHVLLDDIVAKLPVLQKVSVFFSMELTLQIGSTPQVSPVVAFDVHAFDGHELHLACADNVADVRCRVGPSANARLDGGAVCIFSSQSLRQSHLAAPSQRRQAPADRRRGRWLGRGGGERGGDVGQSLLMAYLPFCFELG